MTPSARLQAALDLLQEIGRTPRPADALVSAYFRARRYIGSHDRAAISSMLYNALRHHARSGWWINQKTEHRDQESETGDAGKAFRFRFLAYLALVEKMPPRRIDELFDGGKFAPAALTDDERVFLRKLETHTIHHPHMPENVAVECPDWAYASLKERFGENFEREMNALLQPAPLDLRVNTLKVTRDEALKELQEAGFKALPCSFSPLGIRLHERPSLAALGLLKQGRAEIQDEGSQLAAAMVDARPGMRVIDFCAGAGGKTLAIAAQMRNKGRIIACDVLEKRLKRSTERFRRASAHNIETRALKNAHDPWIKKHKGDFDRVLVDAPCSGVGAWRRNPDARWRTGGIDENAENENANEQNGIGENANKETGNGKNAHGLMPALGPGLDALLKLQAEILAGAARLVKKGGRLIYATCSLLPEENEKQIEKFLEAHKDFHLVPASGILRDAHPPLAGGSNSPPRKRGEFGEGSNSYLSLTPAQHNTDGFFAAAMERN